MNENNITPKKQNQQTVEKVDVTPETQDSGTKDKSKLEGKLEAAKYALELDLSPGEVAMSLNLPLADVKAIKASLTDSA